MISKEAQATIDMLMTKKMAAKKSGTKSETTIDSIYKMVFATRNMEYEYSKNIPTPSGLTLKYEMADNVHGEWLQYLASDPDKMDDKVILFIHGGSFATGSAISRRKLAGKLALNAKVDTFSINYRQCPEYRYPAPLDDCVTAFIWLLKKGYFPKNIVLFGESAGGNLALALVHYLKDHYFPLPGGICVFSPPVDFVTGFDSWVTHSNRDVMCGEIFDESEIESRLKKLHSGDIPLRSLYCNNEEAASPYVSPIRGDFTGFPKLMLQVGTEEIYYDDAIETERKAKSAGVNVTLHTWKGMFHVFAIFDSPETEAVCKEIGQFVRDV